MPRERAMIGMVQSSKKFEVELQDFLGKDYKAPDRSAYPDAESLVGKLGQFILYQLTGSPSFAELRTSVQSIALVAENVLAETPGKAAFDWIQKSVSWIERLNDAVTTESPFEAAVGDILVIPGVAAKRLLTEGEHIFLKVPDDLRKTLSEHGIFMQTNKQDGGTLRVVFKKGGAHHSVGGVAIRWCPLLFDCLRADVSTLDEWETDLTKTLKDFNQFYSETKSHAPSDENNLYRWHGFREQVAALLEEGVKSLVVAPAKGLVDSFQRLLTSINSYLAKFSNADLDQRFARRRYEESGSLLDDRFLLLESLSYRKSLSESPQDASAAQYPQQAQGQALFRDTCRSFLEKGLTRGMKLLGMDYGPDAQDRQEVEAYCAFKAWEIENEMFDRFQGTLGISRVSDEYRDKARSLRYNLEDKKNLTLAPRVLLGDVDATTLVTMTVEELASQKVKLDRAKVEEEAMRNLVLTNSVALTKDAPESATVAEIASVNQKDKTSLSTDTASGKQEGEAAQASLFNSPETKPRSVVSVGPKVALSSSEVNTRMDEESITTPPKLSATGRPPAPPSLIAAVVKASGPPPPPPSLAAFAGASSSAEAPRDRGKRVMSSSGGDRFKIEISSPKIAFHGSFYLEDDSQAGVNQFVPETLTEKGRLKIEEFEKFLSDKLSSGRWHAIPLRMMPYTDRDEQLYRKFYKEYEAKIRIAMFAINGQSSKVFLVTPRFHGAVTSATGRISLTNKTSTYAIVLTKEMLWI
jgi:hypothetical protein